MSLFLSLTLILGQTLPTVAGHKASSAEGWVEICSDGGSYFVQIDNSGQKEMPDCTHCSLCLLPTADLQSLQTKQQSVLVQFGFETQSYPIDMTVNSDRPEQYWVACRGPPILSKTKNIADLADLIGKDLPVNNSDTGSLPCA